MTRISPVSETLRDTFEAWASSDNRAIQPLEFEKRTDDNNHYYESDYDNNAFIGWKAARTGFAQTPADTIDKDERDRIIETCATVAEGFDAACDSPRMKLFVEAGVVLAVYKRDGEIGAAIRALKTLSDTSQLGKSQ